VSDMIVVTGATGKLGGLVVRGLLSRLPAAQIGVSVRDPGAASALRARGVRVRHGDFVQPETLREAFAGALRLLIISSNAAAYGGDPVAQHRAAIDAAKYTKQSWRTSLSISSFALSAADWTARMVTRMERWWCGIAILTDLWEAGKSRGALAEVRLA
jgi:uncharacterized protein YbjT (DUF2867 family)